MDNRPILSILIPTIREREEYLSRLLFYLEKQIGERSNMVNIIINNNHGTTGKKRNQLIETARGYDSMAVAFFDDDDLPGTNYISKNLEGIMSGADCCSLVGNIYFGKKKGNDFFHSIKYHEWFEDSKGYYRMPNHLNAIRLEHYDGIEFHDKNFGEDAHFSMDMRDTGRLKTEYEITDVIYHYFTGAKDMNWQNEYYKNVVL